VYIPSEGDESQGISRNTAFAGLPDDWVCPECKAEQSEFEMVDSCDQVVPNEI
jgi:rubredoxin